ncbi:formimidoylglutamase [Paenibacillus sp. CGMCC 1.16610]|uniref:Formimidoylglutamase n=1 Tax=Paenibacillus anseongense TaxID=2682845 RepID=A0ABW9U5D6_9BACL|nr:MULTISPECIES: formimidoylglutamase [Paenibacillus]MBA2943039.1 formimidoylglutamase [Paenibacillus sp. CGMCC 1.16610]MVQ33535.1 formimidoylglutamase [Paenibacillus anseongense]
MSDEIPYLKSPDQAAFRDHMETKVAQWIRPWDGHEELLAGIVGVPLSKSSISHSGASTTPATVRAAFKSFTTYSMEYGVDLQDLAVRDLGDIQMHVTDIAECHRRIEDSLRVLYKEQPNLIPIIVGGDHSTSCPSLKAFADRHPGQKVGIIHFDAHHDVRNFEDGGVTNGTPFRGILESGVVHGPDIVQIGIRGFMNSKPYHDYVKSKGVHVYTSRDVRRMGIDAVLDEAIGLAGKNTDVLYVSFDVDVIDQAYAPGCPAIGTGGMNPWDAMDALYRLGALPKVQGLDFVCIDPTVDLRNVTSRLAVQFMLSFLAGVAARPI